jgi:hypothetical protein
MEKYTTPTCCTNTVVSSPPVTLINSILLRQNTLLHNVTFGHSSVNTMHKLCHQVYYQDIQLKKAASDVVDKAKWTSQDQSLFLQKTKGINNNTEHFTVSQCSAFMS